jgi:hypothetical protein
MTEPLTNWKLLVAAYCGDRSNAHERSIPDDFVIPVDLGEWITGLASAAPAPGLLNFKLNVVAALLLNERSIGFWESADTLELLEAMAAAARDWLQEPTYTAFKRATDLANELGDLPFTVKLVADSKHAFSAATAALATVQEVRDSPQPDCNDTSICTTTYSIYASIAGEHLARIVGEAEIRNYLENGIITWVNSC